jgi:serine/threonine-protein kinase
VLKLIAERATRNHVHHPDGGGFDLTGAMEGSEPGCITLDMQGIGVVVLPRELTLTIPEQDPLTEWAYYRLETGDLAPTGIYEEVRRDREELVEMAPRAYIHRMHWDTGCYGSDEKGHSIPLPKEARLVFRYLRGPFLIVAKGSTYNASRLTYDGQHAMTTADQFKRMICSTVQDLHQYKIYGVDVLGGETPADHRKPICR